MGGHGKMQRPRLRSEGSSTGPDLSEVEAALNPFARSSTLSSDCLTDGYARSTCARPRPARRASPDFGKDSDCPLIQRHRLD